MANPRSLHERLGPTLESINALRRDEAGIGTLGIILIILLVLILFGVIGFSINA